MDWTTIEVIKGYRLPDLEKTSFLKDTVRKKKEKLIIVFYYVIRNDEIMLEDMNNVLNSGDIPNIYKEEDYEEINKAVQ